VFRREREDGDGFGDVRLDPRSKLGRGRLVLLGNDFDPPVRLGAIGRIEDVIKDTGRTSLRTLTFKKHFRAAPRPILGEPNSDCQTKQDDARAVSVQSRAL